MRKRLDGDELFTEILEYFLVISNDLRVGRNDTELGDEGISSHNEERMILHTAGASWKTTSVAIAPSPMRIFAILTGGFFIPK